MWRGSGSNEKRNAWGFNALTKLQLGDFSPRLFAKRFRASEDLVLKLDVYKSLDKHRGCVNTVSFNATGDVLMSGSDDKMVMLWNWEMGSVKLAFQSGHVYNVSRAKFMPYTNDQNIITCGAEGQVRGALIREGGRVDTIILGKHDGRVHEIAIEPGSPYVFYTCAEDGLVQRFDLRARNSVRLFTCHPFRHKSRYMPVIYLDTIAIDNRNPNLFAIAGSDEFARLYDIRNLNQNGQSADCFCPPHLIRHATVRITGVAFSEQSELLVSYHNENIYLFSKDMGLGPDPIMASKTNVPHPLLKSPLETKVHEPWVQVYSGHQNLRTVKGLTFFGPDSEYVASGSDCGRIFIWKKKGGKLLRAMEGDEYIVNCIESHPSLPTLASSGTDSDIKIFSPKADASTTRTDLLDELAPDQFVWTIHAEDDYLRSDEDEDINGHNYDTRNNQHGGASHNNGGDHHEYDQAFQL